MAITTVISSEAIDGGLFLSVFPRDLLEWECLDFRNQLLPAVLLTLVLLMCVTYTLCLWGGGYKTPPVIEFKDTYGQHFNGYTHVFEVHLFNGVVDDITGSRVIPEIDMAAAQTEGVESQFA